MNSSASSWSRATLSHDATIEEVIRNLDEVSIQIVLLVSDKGVLIGTISDGDIRRGLLKGLTLSSPASNIVNRNPVVVPPNVSRDLVKRLMTANKIRQIPVLNENHEIVGLHLLSQIIQPAERPNLFLIMAGGLGSRLRPQTDHCPKPMLPILGKPMLEHIIERAKLQGFRQFVIAIHYLGEVIESYFGDGRRFDVEIQYLREESPLGTAGALSLFKTNLTESLVVTNGDVMTDIHYGELLDFQFQHIALATMAVRLHEWQHPFGVVKTEGADIVGFQEKPIARHYINAGVYALDPSVLRFLQQGEPCDMPTLFERLRLAGKRTIAYPMYEPWLDVGTSEDLKKAAVQRFTT